jgi:hypothetical protein
VTPIPIGAPRVRGRSPNFRRGELFRRCLDALTAAGTPMPIRELAQAVLMAKGMDAGDAALIELEMRPLRNALSEAKALGRVRLVGVSGSRLARGRLCNSLSSPLRYRRGTHPEVIVSPHPHDPGCRQCAHCAKAG